MSHKIRATLSLRVCADGREVCNLQSVEGRLLYRHRIEAMWLRQGCRCHICKKLLPRLEATFDHEFGRGLDGAHRDDRIEIDGRPVNAAVCWSCNMKKGSKRGYD